MSDSEQDRTRQEAHRELDDGLDRISGLIHATVDPDEILDFVVTEVVGATRADSAVIYVRENEKWVIRHLHGLPEELRGRHLDKSELRASSRALASHRVVVINDTAASDEVTREMVERYGIKALMDSELIIGEGVFADFAVHHHTPAGQFDALDVRFMERVAAAVALALRNAHLFGRLQATADRATFLSDLVEHSSQPFLVSRPDGHLLMANQALLRLFGYTHEELEHSHWETFTHPEFLEEQRRLLEQQDRTGEPQTFQSEYRTKEGRWVPVEVKLHRVRGDRAPSYRYAFITDISERRRAEAALRETEARFRAVFEHGPMGIVILDTAGVILRANARFGAMLGRPVDALNGQPLAALTHEESIHECDQAFRQLGSGTTTFYDMERRYRRSDDGTLWVQETGSAVRGPDGAPLYYILMQDDITARKGVEEQIRHLAQHDPLTGLPNRRLFNELLERAVALGRRTGRPLALGFLDLDRFKDVNDTLGHQAGDLLLQQATRRLRERVRRSDVVARVGGDEFNIILTDVGTSERVADVARDLVDAFKAPFTVNGQTVHLSATLGIGLFPDDAQDADTLLRYADIAMYFAKQQGRNRFQFFNHEINARSIHRLRMENELRAALERGELEICYQPLIDLGNRSVRAVEALVRWNHPRLGRLEPDHFLPIAEEIGAIIAIDEWVLLTACREASRWPADTAASLAVNLSARQFQRTDLPNAVAATLRESGLAAGRLELEITESVAMGDIDRALPQMHALREMGVRLVIDDFGTGYSSLSYLKRMPIYRLKIDRSFVRDMAFDADDRAIVTAVTTLAHTLQLRVVAEGVETAEQLGLLRGFACDEAQGYFFDAPLLPEQLRARLAEYPPSMLH